MDVFLIVLSVIVLIVVLVASVFFLFKKSPTLAGEAYKDLVESLGENNKLTNNELRLLRSDMEQMRQKHKTESEELRQKINRDRRIIAELENKIMLFEAFGDDMPFAYWMKDNNGVMLHINDEYESLFLKPRGDTKLAYKGKTDVEYWGETIGRAYHSNDMKIITGSVEFFMGIEPIFIGNSNVSKKYLIIKYPRFLGKTRVGIAGMAIPMEESFFQDNKTTREFIKYMIEKGNLEDAIANMKRLVDDQMQGDILHIQSRYATLILEERQGIISKEDSRLERNKIIKTMIDIINQV